MRRLWIIILLSLAVVSCTTLSPPELTATAEIWTPTQEGAVTPTMPFATNTPGPFWDRSCTDLPAINQNACMIQEPGTNEPYLNAIVVLPNINGGYGDHMTDVSYENGKPKIDVVSRAGQFSGTVSLFFDRPGHQWPLGPGECHAVNLDLDADFLGEDVEAMKDQLAMRLILHLDNGEVIELWDNPFDRGTGSSRTLSGHRAMHWVFYTLAGNRAIDELELRYIATQPVTSPGSDVVLNWVVFHKVSHAECANTGPAF